MKQQIEILQFTPSDFFKGDGTHDIDYRHYMILAIKQQAADDANAKLEKWLAEAQTVYGRYGQGYTKDGVCLEWYRHEPVLPQDAEQVAKLLCIKPFVIGNTNE